MVAIISVVAAVLNTLLLIYVLVLLVRLIFEYIPMFNREWRPRGAVLVVAEAVYTVTDPPLKALRRVIPPLRIGPVAIDLAFGIVLILCFVLLGVTRSLAAL